MPFSAAAVEREMHVVDQDGVVYKGAAAIFKITEQYPRLGMATRLLAAADHGFGAAGLRPGGGQPPVHCRSGEPAVLAEGHRDHGLLHGPCLVAASLGRTALISADSNFKPATRPRRLGGAGYAGGAVCARRPDPAIAQAPKIHCRLSCDHRRLLSARPKALQPWVFQYGSLLAVLALFTWQSDDVAGQRRTLNFSRLVVAGTYVFSGLQKLNWNFVDNDFPWIGQPIAKVFLLSTGAVQVLGICAPFVQIAFGAELLTRRFRRVSLVLAVAMHVFILAMLGPLDRLEQRGLALDRRDGGVRYSAVCRREFSPRDVIWSNGHHIHRAALLLFAMLRPEPLHLWDSYLVRAVFRQSERGGDLSLRRRPASAAIRTRLPCGHTSANTNVLNVQRWAIEDLNVMPYPETRVYKSIAKTVCGALSDSGQLVLIVREQRLFFTAGARLSMWRFVTRRLASAGYGHASASAAPAR